MRTSDILAKSIRRFESFRRKAYQDAKGVWTIGYGHTADVKEGDCISRKVAEQLLLDDLKEFESYVDSLNIPYCIVIGQDEVDKGQYTLKNMATGEQELLSMDEIVAKLK